MKHDDSTDINKWVLSTVGLETTSTNGEKFGGTAIFILYNNKHYLVTARHVLVDTASQDHQGIFWQINLTGNVGSIGESDSLVADSAKGTYVRAPLGVLVGLSDDAYILSKNSAEDIGIINLEKDPRGKRIIQLLKRRQNVPIEAQDIGGSAQVGQRITAVGYPLESKIWSVPMHPALAHWQSNAIQLPVITNGIISSWPKDKYYFEGDIFVYHGNSGGPVLSGNKLLGIVSGASYEDIAVDSTKKHYYRKPHLIFIKAALIVSLLKELERM